MFEMQCDLLKGIEGDLFTAKKRRSVKAAPSLRGEGDAPACRTRTRHQRGGGARMWISHKQCLKTHREEPRFLDPKRRLLACNWHEAERRILFSLGRTTPPSGRNRWPHPAHRPPQGGAAVGGSGVTEPNKRGLKLLSQNPVVKTSL